jgi:PRTRC genetic system ThiF family protein
LKQKGLTLFRRNRLKRYEVGHPKSVVLVNRLNLFWNLGWDAVPEHLVGKQRLDRVDIVIGCVDTRAARAAIHECTSGWDSTAYWLDIGSTADAGQFILGEPSNQVNRRCRTRLRTVAELYPDAVDGTLDDDELPSCSAIESLDRQSPFINQVLAQHALALLARLFRYGNINYHGGFINLREGCGARLAVDPSVWKRIRRRCKPKLRAT